FGLFKTLKGMSKSSNSSCIGDDSTKCKESHSLVSERREVFRGEGHQEVHRQHLQQLVWNFALFSQLLVECPSCCLCPKVWIFRDEIFQYGQLSYSKDITV